MVNRRSPVWHSSGQTTTIAKQPTTVKITTARTPSICPKCGTTRRTGQRSCCASDGAWFNNCGDAGDSNFDHTWLEGAESCITDVTNTITDNCISGFSNCFISHNDFSSAENKLTNPKAMDKDENGNLYGNCATAILNRVEGELCCTAGMKQLAACVPKEVGDYTLCKNSWNTAYESNFYDKAQAIITAFKADIGGYCASYQASDLAKTTRAPSVCAKCGANKRGRLSCCAPGGAWYNNCGTGYDYSWTEGFLICNSESSYACLSICLCVCVFLDP